MYSSSHKDSENVYFDLSGTYRSPVIQEKVKSQILGPTGVKNANMLQFCCKWSQNDSLATTTNIKNSLHFVTWVTLKKCRAQYAVNGCWPILNVTKVMKYPRWCKLFLISIVATRRSFWDNFDQNQSIFCVFDPCRTQNLTFDLFLYNWRTTHCRLNYTFSESSRAEEYIGIAFNTIWAIVKFDPCTKFNDPFRPFPISWFF